MLEQLSNIGTVSVREFRRIFRIFGGKWRKAVKFSYISIDNVRATL